MRSAMLSALRGLGIGLAIVLPGISGGTAALMLGIYRDFVEALRYLRWRQEAWLLAGTLAGVLTGARVAGFLLDAAPRLVMAFLLGLVLGALPRVFRQAGRLTLRKAALAAAGGAVTWAFAIAGGPLAGPASLGGLFLAGAAASAVMVLPGVSGGTLLLVLGQYERALEALNQLDPAALAALGAGGFVGLALLSRAVLHLLSRWPQGTMALLGGMMAGSVRCLWPAGVRPPEMAAMGLGIILMVFGRRK